MSSTEVAPKQGIQKFVWQFVGAAVNAVLLVAYYPRDEYWSEDFYIALASTGLQITSAFLTYMVPNLRDARYLKTGVALTFVVLQVLVAVIPGGITQLEVNQIITAVVAFIGTAVHSNGEVTGSLTDPPVPTVVETQVPVPVVVPENTPVTIEPKVVPGEVVPREALERREIGGYTFTFEKNSSDG